MDDYFCYGCCYYSEICGEKVCLSLNGCERDCEGKDSYSSSNDYDKEILNLFEE